MRASAIIVAAGNGARLGRGEPKAFIRLRGRPILEYSLATMAAVTGIDEIVVAVPIGMESAARACAAAARVVAPVKITAGGSERQDSVRIALALTSAENELVIIHDAARPFAAAALFERCLEGAARLGSAIAAIPVSDTLKQVKDGRVQATVTRAGLWCAQTPQAFRRSMIIEAHARAKREKIGATDDADLAERMGIAVEIVESPGPNLKITTAADFQLAEAMAAALARA